MMKELSQLDDNKKWMQSGKIGCTFAAMFARNPDKINWYTTQMNLDMVLSLDNIPKDTIILSLQFPNADIHSVKEWALKNNFYIENVANDFEGLRYKIDSNVAWVQYFGPDSHVKTRQAPIPELMFCLKLPPQYYFKVGFKGILHLAHASIQGITSKAADLLYNSSFANTEKRLGHKPTDEQAAKTTYKI